MQPAAIPAINACLEKLPPGQRYLTIQPQTSRGSARTASLSVGSCPACGEFFCRATKPAGELPSSEPHLAKAGKLESFGKHSPRLQELRS